MNSSSIASFARLPKLHPLKAREKLLASYRRCQSGKWGVWPALGKLARQPMNMGNLDYDLLLGVTSNGFGI